MRFGVLTHRAAHYALVCAALLACSAQVGKADILISKDVTQNVSCSAGVCTPTSHKAVLNVGELTRMLKRGDVKLAPSSAASDIEITANLTWTNNSRLTLDAYHSIAVLQPVTVAGPGGITIVVNDGGKGGDYSFSGKGRLDFWDTNASLVIGNQTFVLVNSIGALATAIASNPNGAFALAKDYDASVDGTYGTSPVTTDFNGTFDGLGHQIASLTVNDASAAVNTETGFFASTASAAIVRDISFPHIYMRGGIHGYLGGIVGENKGSIFHASVVGLIDGQNMSDFIGAIAGESYGTVRDTHFTGTALGGSGLVGYNHGLVDRSDSTGLVTSYKVRCEATGGFYGALVAINGGTISNSHSTSAIKNHVCAASVGGLVGGNAGFITRSYATGKVTTVPGKPGGLAGFNDGIIVLSFATGDVSGSGTATHGDGEEIGGLVGDNSGGFIADCYATGSVSAAGSYVGGFVGNGGQLAAGTVESSYSTGDVSGGTGLNADLGGFSGWGRYNQHDYWNLDTSGVSDPSKGCGDVSNCQGITGLTSQQLQSGLPAGFSPKHWVIDPNVNNGFPSLKANPPPQ